MVGLEVKAGDAFTEHLRHGGFTNRSDTVRKTLHVGYGPHWMMSQNIATMDEPQHITEETAARFDEEQRNLFRAWPNPVFAVKDGNMRAISYNLTYICIF